MAGNARVGAVRGGRGGAVRLPARRDVPQTVAGHQFALPPAGGARLPGSVEEPVGDGPAAGAPALVRLQRGLLHGARGHQERRAALLHAAQRQLSGQRLVRLRLPAVLVVLAARLRPRPGLLAALAAQPPHRRPPPARPALAQARPPALSGLSTFVFFFERKSVVVPAARDRTRRLLSDLNFRLPSVLPV